MISCKGRKLTREVSQLLANLVGIPMDLSLKLTIKPPKAYQDPLDFKEGSEQNKGFSPYSLRCINITIFLPIIGLNYVHKSYF